MKICRDQVYLLQCKPYRESSALVRGFSAEHGIVSGVIRGVYHTSNKAQQKRASLQLGNQLEWQWYAKQQSLKIISSCELITHNRIAPTKALLCLCYIHELLLNFLPEEQISTPLYQSYQIILNTLTVVDDIEILLREFENLLFSEMGFAIDFTWDNSRDQPVQPQQQYSLHPEWGIISASELSSGLRVLGEDLWQLAQKNYESISIRRLAKHINRLIIDFHLAGKPLKARALYRQLSL